MCSLHTIATPPKAPGYRWLLKTNEWPGLYKRVLTGEEFPNTTHFTHLRDLSIPCRTTTWASAKARAASSRRTKCLLFWIHRSSRVNRVTIMYSCAFYYLLLSLGVQFLVGSVISSNNPLTTCQKPLRPCRWNLWSSNSKTGLETLR